MKNLFLILLILLATKAVKCETVKVDLETIRIIDLASKEFSIKTEYLLKIAYIESRFKTKAVNINKNGTVDVGLFQINTIHWNTTCKGLNIFTTKGNAFCAAKLLKRAKRYKENDEYWLGRYHSKTPSLKRKYYKLINGVNLDSIEIKEVKNENFK